MIRQTCSECGMKLSVMDELAGKSIVCPGCQNSVRLPKTNTAVVTPKRTAEPIAPSRPDAFQSGEPSRPRRPAPERDEREDEDDFSRRPRRSRAGRSTRRRGVSSGFGFELSSVAIFLIVVAVLFFVFLGLSLAVPQLIFLPVGLVVVVQLIGSLWFLGVAFGEGALHGIACIFVPFYFLIFLLLHFEDAKEPFYVMLAPSCLGGICFLVLFQETAPAPNVVAAAPPAVPFVPAADPVPPRPDPAPADPVPPPRPIERPRPSDRIRPTIPARPAEPVIPVVKLTTPDPVDPAKVATGLRAHWAFDEGKGFKATDSGPYRLEAGLSGCSWGPGVRGEAVQLNGVTDFVRLSPAPALSFPDRAPFTIAAWVKTPNSKGIILSLRPMKDAPYDMLNVVLNSGKIVVQIRHQGNPMYPDEAKASHQIDDDAWHHFAVVRGLDGEVYLFQDGVLNDKAKGRLSHRPQYGKLITNNRVIGAEAMLLTGNRHPLYDHSRYMGAIDDLCFFGAALGEPQIRQLSKRE